MAIPRLLQDYRDRIVPEMMQKFEAWKNEIVSKLEEIRCGVIDVETEVQKTREIYT